MILKKFVNSAALLLLLLTGAITSSCSKTESYSELLREEEKAVNWYLATQKVELEIPEDSISFITGEDAPFYKLDENGYVYMQVISKGELTPEGKIANPVKSGDLVYFRFTRENLKFLYEGLEAGSEGNSENLTNGTSSFVYKNTYLQSTTSFGTGIQMPMKFLGYDSEVNLVLRSYYGFSTDQTSCYPYLINIRYFKPEY